MSQITYISDPNKHIEKYLDYYLSPENKLDYAVLIDGEWGSGKTWFIKEYIEKTKQDGRQVAYVSLNGISKKSEIDDEIFRCIHPKLASKEAKLAGKIIKGALKATLRFDWDGDSKPDGSASLSIPDINLPEYLKINDKFFLVFDDFERCEIKKEEVLGYINFFVEQENIKTLIISNQKEINDNDDFKKRKEKLIGATFNYTEDQKLAIKKILSEINNSHLKSELLSKESFIIQVFNSIGYKNLRSFKQAINDFERFYKREYFESDGVFDDIIFEKILKSFLILSLENKFGRFYNGILNFKKDILLDEKPSQQEYENKIFESILWFEGEDAQNFRRKYNCNIKNFVFSIKLWSNILDMNILDESKIKEELDEKYFYPLKNQPIWFKLMGFYDLSEENFNDLAVSAKETIEYDKLDNFSDVLHTISMLVYFKEQSLICFPVENLIERALNRIKIIFPINEKMKRIEDSSFREHSGQYGFYAKGIDKFDRFIDAVVSIYEEKYHQQNSEREKELLELMENNSALFYQRLTLTNSIENHYFDYAILKYLDVEGFAKKLCNIKYSNSMDVLDAMKKRYTIQTSIPIYLEEKEWFERVISLIENDILPSAPLLIKAKISNKILPYLLEVQEEAYHG